MYRRAGNSTNQPGRRQFDGIVVNYLTEEGYYVLMKLSPEELYQIICNLPNEPTEIRLAELRTELSPEKLDEAVDSIIQEAYDDKDKPLDPFRIEDSRYVRRNTWWRVKQLYKKMKLFKTADIKAEMSKPTPKLESETAGKLRKKKGEKIEKESRLSVLLGGMKENARASIETQPESAPSQPQPQRQQQPLVLKRHMLDEIRAAKDETSEFMTKVSSSEEASERQPEPSDHTEPEEEEQSHLDSPPSPPGCAPKFKAAGTGATFQAAYCRWPRRRAKTPSHCEEDVETQIKSDTESQLAEPEPIIPKQKSHLSTLCRVPKNGAAQSSERREKKVSTEESEPVIPNPNLNENGKAILQSIKLASQKLLCFAENVKEYVQKLKKRSEKVKKMAVETQLQLKAATVLLESAAGLLETASSSHAAEKLEKCSKTLKVLTRKLKSLSEEDAPPKKKENSCCVRIRAKIGHVNPPNVKAIARTVDAESQTCMRNSSEKVRSSVETTLLKSITTNVKAIIKLIVAQHRALTLGIFDEGTKITLQKIELGSLKICCAQKARRIAKEQESTEETEAEDEPKPASSSNETKCFLKVCRKKPEINAAKVEAAEEEEEPQHEEAGDEAEGLKESLTKSVVMMLGYAISNSGFDRFSDELSFPVTSFVQKILEEVKDEPILMDLAKIESKLHLLVYKDLHQMWKKAEFIMMFIDCNSRIVNDIIAICFKNHLIKPKKPSVFRRFLNFFRRKSD